MNEFYKYLSDLTVPALIGVGLYYFNAFKNSIDRIEKSIGSLNMNMATLITKDKEKDRRMYEISEAHKLYRVETNKRIDELHDALELTRLRVHDITNDLGSKVALNQERIKQLTKRGQND